MATKISQKGIRTAESAVSADVAGRYAEAVRLYGDAVEMLLCGSKYEKNPFTVDHLRFYAEDCALLRARSARALSCAWSRRLSCFCALALSFHCDRNRAPFSGALAALLCRATARLLLLSLLLSLSLTPLHPPPSTTPPHARVQICLALKPLKCTSPCRLSWTCHRLRWRRWMVHRCGKR